MRVRGPAALLEQTRESLVNRTHPTLARRLDQARAEVSWAERGLALVEELEGRGD